MAKSTGKVTIKKYANRRLYDTESSAYITLDRLAQIHYAAAKHLEHRGRKSTQSTR